MILILKWFLMPFSLLYTVITGIRNWFYQIGLFKTYKFDVSIISVGNLSVGGTGKSPTIEYLIQSFSKDYRLAVLSRGYKRKSEGFIEVHSNMNASWVGDEPLQFKRKFNNVKIFVDADRKNGIKKIQKHYPEIEIILLDDAYQHRRVHRDINILLTTYQKPFFKDYVLPMGTLRESRLGKNRADIIIVTKCPKSIQETEKNQILIRINPKNNQKVLFSYIDYEDKIVNVKQTLTLDEINNFYLLTGIANPKPLLGFLKSKGKNFKHLKFPDHHNFTKKQMADLNNIKGKIITTEKDYTRLIDNIDKEIFYLPITLRFEKSLKNEILKMLN